jgi:hypothetical protein
LPLSSAPIEVNKSTKTSTIGAGDKQPFSTLESRANNTTEIEVQLLDKIVVCDILLVLENFPVWLLGLEPTRVQKLHILGYSSMAQLLESLSNKGQPGHIIERLLRRFGNTRLSFSRSEGIASKRCLILASGLL